LRLFCLLIAVILLDAGIRITAGPSGAWFMRNGSAPAHPNGGRAFNLAVDHFRQRRRSSMCGAQRTQILGGAKQTPPKKNRPSGRLFFSGACPLPATVMPAAMVMRRPVILVTAIGVMTALVCVVFGTLAATMVRALRPCARRCHTHCERHTECQQFLCQHDHLLWLRVRHTPAPMSADYAAHRACQ
jgi:hypothetical protein